MSKPVEKPPWTKNIPAQCSKIETFPLANLTETQKQCVWSGMRQLDPAMAEAIADGRRAAELDCIDMLRFYNQGSANLKRHLPGGHP